MDYFERLFSPLTIGKHTFKNRIVMSPMHLGLADNGVIGDRLLEFYRRRAEGGVGFIIIGWAATEKIPLDPHPGISIDDDKYIDGFKRMADALHEHDVKLGVQVAPTYVLDGKLSDQMWTLDLIESMIENSTRAAERLKGAGVDSIEIMCMGGSLYSKFLSPVYNRRTGKYGGESLEERLRFPYESLKGIAEVCGDDVVAAARIHGSEFLAGGYGNEQSREIAKKLTEAGAGYISVTGGGHDTRVPQITMQVPAGTYAHLASGVKQVVDVPVIAANRINDPGVAEEILAEGLADMVVMGRALNADPDLPIKAMEGRTDEINFCIGCNQGCLDHVFQMKSIRCTVNPFTAMETELKSAPATEKKKVVVVGAGPGGMTAASMAAERGHDVVLFEKQEYVGGLLNYAALPPGREEIFRFIEYLENQAVITGVDVRIGVEADLDAIMAEKPDVVIIATGSEPIKPPIPGIDSANVVLAEDVLAGRVIPGMNVVVIGGGATGVETADYIARLGAIPAESARFLYEAKAYSAEEALNMSIRGPRKVSIVEMMPKFGANIGKSTRWTILRELDHLGVEMLPQRTAKNIDENGVKISDQDGAETVLPADTVVLALGYRPLDELYKSLREKTEEVHIIGDAKEVRRANEAVWEAADLALSI